MRNRIIIKNIHTNKTYIGKPYIEKPSKENPNIENPNIENPNKEESDKEAPKNKPVKKRIIPIVIVSSCLCAVLIGCVIFIVIKKGKNTEDTTKDTKTSAPAGTDTPASTPTEDLLDTTYEAYREVLVDNHTELNKVEEEHYYNSTNDLKSCALTDLTGDGLPELVTLYCSDQAQVEKDDPRNRIDADLSVYTVIPGETNATEILHLPRVVFFDVVCDVVLLNNGNLMFKMSSFSYNEISYIEYAFDGYSFQPVNTLEFFVSASGESDPEYHFNGVEISKEDYEAQVLKYSGMISNVIVKFPYTKYFDDWEKTIVNVPDLSITYQEAWNLIASAHYSEPATVIEETDTPTPTPTPGVEKENLYSAYTEKLITNECGMITVEGGKRMKPTSALTDLTGDGIPELMTLNCRKESRPNENSYFCIYADISIYTIIPGETTATEMLYLGNIASYGSPIVEEPDVILLTNGNILVRKYSLGLAGPDGEDTIYYEYYTEYALDGCTYQQINQLKYSMLNASDGITEEYWINDATASESDFTSLVNEYKGKFSSVLLMNPRYGTDDLHRPSERFLAGWESAVLSTPNVSMTFDEVWESILSYRSTEKVLSMEQAQDAFENFWNTDENWNLVTKSGYGLSYFSYEFSESDSDDYTCVIRQKTYAGAQTYQYVDYSIDLTTGIVSAELYWYIPDGSAAGNPGLWLTDSVYNVFNALDYL